MDTVATAQVGHQSSHPGWAAAIDRVADLSRLEDDWDSYGSVPLSSVAVSAAKNLLTLFAQKYRVPPSAILPFHISPIPGGGIEIDWRSISSKLEVDIDTDGAVSYLLVQNLGEHETYQEVDNLDPAQIVELVANNFATS